MGIRETQIFGLKEEAEQFIKENVEKIPDVTCPDCGKVITYKQNREVYEDAKDAGMFGDGPTLSKYFLKDGRIVYEKLNKYQPWSSGPCLFLDLVNGDGTILYGWSHDEIHDLI